MRDPRGLTTYQYDALGRLTQVDGPGDANTIAYAYDPSGNRTQMTDPDGGVTTYTYNALNRLVALRDPQERLTRYAYDTAGNLTAIELANGTRIASSYDRLNRLVQVTHQDAAQQPFSRFAYAYDAAGRRTRGEQLAGLTVAYRYDAAGRLIQETRMLNGSEVETTYEYDPVGNRVRLTRGNLAISYAYNALNQLREETRQAHVTLPIEVRGTAQDAHLASVAVNGTPAALEGEAFVAREVLLTPGLNTIMAIATDHAGNVAQTAIRVTLNTQEQIRYLYETNGRLTQRTDEAGMTTYAYDAAGRLASVTLPDGRSARYAYDGNGQRVQVVEDGLTTDWLYDGLNALLERDATGQTLARNTWGVSLGGGIGGLLSRRQGGTNMFYHYDGRGDVVALTDPTGQALESGTYDAFGNLLDQTGSIQQPYRFSTKRLEPISGLYDFGARWYDPGVGRFISPDPMGFGDGPNLYAYVGNDPANFIDPVGLAGVPLKLTDVKRLAELANSLEATRAGTRFNVRGRYATVKGPRGLLVAGTRYRVDHPEVAKYVNPAGAARGAIRIRGAGGLTAILVTTQDILSALEAGRSLWSREFFVDTGVDVSLNVGASVAGAYVGASFGSGVPLVGTAVGGATGFFVGMGLEAVVEAIRVREFLKGQE